MINPRFSLNSQIIPIVQVSTLLFGIALFNTPLAAEAIQFETDIRYNASICVWPNGQFQTICITPSLDGPCILQVACSPNTND